MADLKGSTEVQEVIKAYIMGNSNFDTPDDLGVDDNLLDEGIMDSLGIAEITEFMEKEFDIEIDEDEIDVDNYRSLGTLTEFCANKLAADAA